MARSRFGGSYYDRAGFASDFGAGFQPCRDRSWKCFSQDSRGQDLGRLDPSEKIGFVTLGLRRTAAQQAASSACSRNCRIQGRRIFTAGSRRRSLVSGLGPVPTISRK